MMASDDPLGEAYRFGEYRLEADRRVLTWNDEPAPLPPKAFDTLLALVRRAGTVVDKDALMQAVWPDQYVDENNLSQSIAILRRVLQDRRGLNRYIETVQGRGFRFVAPVERIATQPSPASKRTRIAVLPFANMTGDPDREYVVDGLTEETIAALGQVDPDGLGVVGRTSVMPYKGAVDGVARAGRELGTPYVVEGALRAEGGRMRVTAALARARDRTRIWSASFESEPVSLLAFQRDLAGVIARQVHLHVEPRRVAAMAYRQPAIAEALDCYLRGRYLWHRLTPPTTRMALEMFQRATALDPSYALAWSGIADALCARPITGDAPPREMLPPARAATEAALRAQPDLAEAQASAGFLRFWLDWDWPGAEAAFRRAAALDPSYPLPHRMLGLLYSHLGRTESALSAMRRCRELDPLLPVHHALSAQAAYNVREFELAAQFARQALVIDPDFWIGHYQVANAGIELGDDDVVERALVDGVRASGGNSKFLALKGYLRARRGRIDDARDVLATLASLASERYVPPCAMALVHAGLGDADSAADWLERAWDSRDVHLMFPQADVKWDAVKRHPRVSAVLRRCAFALDPARDYGVLGLGA